MVWLGLRGRGRFKSVIIDVTTEINYRCNYRTVFSNKYNVKTCMYTISTK